MRHARSAPVLGGSPESFQGSPTKPQDIFNRFVCHGAVAEDGHTPPVATSNSGVRFKDSVELRRLLAGVGVAVRRAVHGNHLEHRAVLEVRESGDLVGLVVQDEVEIVVS